MSGATPLTVRGAARLEAALTARRARGESALVAFVTAGFPRRDAWVDELCRIAEVADAVEIGVPFTDPMADGVTIQRASRAALEAGVSLAWILETIAGFAHRPPAPLALMSYLNPLHAFGYERLAAAASEAGIDGFIVPDLPLDEAGPLRDALDAKGLALVQLVTPVTTAARLDALVRASRGFVYAVTQTGVTGGDVAIPETTAAYLARVRALASIPVLAGFGVRTKEHVRALAPHADGVIVGSALVEVMERGGDAAAFLKELRS